MAEWKTNGIKMKRIYIDGGMEDKWNKNDEPTSQRWSS